MMMTEHIETEGTHYAPSDFELTGEGRKDRDAYYTPAWCTDLLWQCDFHKVPPWIQGLTYRNFILEPACGNGGIADVLDRYTNVQRADIETGENFFDAIPGEDWTPTDAIITNPPYKYAPEFVRHALDFTPYVAMFLRLTFLEYAKNRRDVLNLLASVLITERVPFIEGSSKCDSVPHAWFFWEFAQSHDARIHFATPDEIARAKGQTELGI